ncbi:MAG: class A beta-lactamase-related serine hydrolase [Thermoleophilia bacterium]|nr:class A beta-lactamase-related serine hydrolase [Thermoleophilia bacterium]MDH4339707.1 class A beta-lactamase-related serine hydrolase [Thermoleophilia bacterium]
MIATTPLPPPAIEQPAAHQVSYGIVTGRAARGTVRVIVSANGRRLSSKPLRGQRFSLRVSLPSGDVSVRVTTVARDGRRSSHAVAEVFGLPAGSRPRIVRSRQDHLLAQKLRGLARDYSGTAGVYVQSLTGGAGAAWNAKAQFPAASTLKLAIATAVLAEHPGVPAPGSSVHGLMRSMITRSDNASANALEIWLAGSTSAGSRRVNSLMRSIGLVDSDMYGGYELRTLASRIPVRVERQPVFGFGKHTSAFDMASLLRAVWLASGSLGPLRKAQPGFTAADGRYLLWLLAHVSDIPKLDRVRQGNPGVVVLHKSGWINSARHDAGLVFWRGGVFVAGVMTWSSWSAGSSSDRLAGKIAALTLERLRRTEG